MLVLANPSEADLVSDIPPPRIVSRELYLARQRVHLLRRLLRLSESKAIVLNVKADSTATTAEGLVNRG